MKKILCNKYVQKALVGAVAGLLGLNLASCSVGVEHVQTETGLGTITVDKVEVTDEKN